MWPRKLQPQTQNRSNLDSGRPHGTRVQGQAQAGLTRSPTEPSVKAELRPSLASHSRTEEVGRRPLFPIEFGFMAGQCLCATEDGVKGGPAGRGTESLREYVAARGIQSDFLIMYSKVNDGMMKK
jgi:hypothetical protein